MQCVDAAAVCRRHPHRGLSGWPLKPYAILHSPFREVLFFGRRQHAGGRSHVSLRCAALPPPGHDLWPDDRKTARQSQRWEVFGVDYRDEMEVESGQMLVNKRACWRALKLCNWYNEHADFFYRVVYGDKDTFRFAWHRCGRRSRCRAGVGPHSLHALPARPGGSPRVPASLPGKMVVAGQPALVGFQHERKCLQYLDELRRRWKPGGEAKRKTDDE